MQKLDEVKMRKGLEWGKWTTMVLWQYHMLIALVLALSPLPAHAGSQTFTSSGTFTVPNYESLTVTVNGAGGGGGGGGGGAGSSTSGKSCVTGNVGGSGTSGTGAGSASFGSSVAVVSNGGGSGGGGYGGGTGGGGGSAGSAGTASGGDTNTTGGGSSGGSGGGGGNGGGNGIGGAGGASGSAGSAPTGDGGYGGGGGGKGGRAVKTWAAGADGAPSPGASITVTVNSAGGGGNGGAGGYGDCVSGQSGNNGSSGVGGSVAITWTVTPDTTFTQNATVQGALSITGDLSKGSGSFVIDHPLDPANKLLYHSFVESPYAMNMYDGVAKLDLRGEATVALPKYFEALNKDFRYQLKPIDEPMPNLFVKNEIEKNKFEIGGGTPHGKISWQVTGVRHDPYILANPVIPEVEKGPDQIVDKGEYLFSEARSAGFFSPIVSVLGNLWNAFFGWNGS